MIKMELTEKEQKVLELIHSTRDGKLKIDVEDGEPVRVEQILEGYPPRLIPGRRHIK